ncbi:TonB-dependent receptor [Gluconacetobacter diazotrophicus]|uniref:TonB-dependent receptor n=1 Tax=Gluconacetobacter diazotrophicus TaxID=33996 RepID=A0A7W4I4F2_GLUDI|nr:TonB-dependent receptor [Gluconacetobacter diazotrophicus]MBB2155746.1 TonB-dependent receptor [Gluconacetobacter diazotrophicus]
MSRFPAAPSPAEAALCGCIVAFCAHAAPARAGDPVVTLPSLSIEATDLPSLADSPLSASSPGASDRAAAQLGSPDAVALFHDTPGFSAYSAGGISSLPVLNGMADDRVATVVDGVRISAGCPNHMNPAMSYIDPDSVQTATAIAGITPVSLGGDSTAGTVDVERRDPQFARKGQILVTGHVTGNYRSNGGGSGASGTVTLADDTFSLRYTASYAHAGDYHAGGGGGVVRSTDYLTFNHAMTLGMHKGNHLLALTAGQQDTPYEGFPNQYMDMTNNRSTYVNGKYDGSFDWGDLEVRGYWQRVDHVMDMLGDKGGHSPTTGMPMNTDSRMAGYTLKATIPLGPRDTLRLGSSFDHDGLNDWWPPLQGSMMMGPGTFHNVNDGHRDRLGHYAEWEAQWTHRLSTLLGFRNDLVMMNTGPVSPYSWTGMMAAADATAARAFNAMDRGRTDVNFDVTALTRWQALDSLTIEGGYARKTRSPNLYERYAWGRGAMATKMIGWFGDGNGYVGNPNLTPEIANTASITIDWHDPHGQAWDLKIQPYYTYTHHYVNVVRLAQYSNGTSLLGFVNHDAQSYGINASGSYRLWNTVRYGQGDLVGTVDWVRGQDLVTRSGLYHQMPANGMVGVHETVGNWTGRVEMTFVKSKDTVDWLRNEPRTPGYALLGLGGSYRWRYLTLNAGIDNVMNQKYYLPLGGLSLGDYDATGVLGPLKGMGRSFNVSLTGSF